MMVLGRWDLDLWGAGLAFGAIAGLATGLVCGGMALRTAYHVALEAAATRGDPLDGEEA